MAFLRTEYGLDLPIWHQYLIWMGDLLQGDPGYSFQYNLPVSQVVGDRLLLTFIVSFSTILFTYIVRLPDRRLFGDPSIQRRGLRADLHRLFSASPHPTSFWHW